MRFAGPTACFLVDGGRLCDDWEGAGGAGEEEDLCAAGDKVAEDGGGRGGDAGRDTDGAGEAEGLCDDGVEVGDVCCEEVGEAWLSGGRGGR